MGAEAAALGQGQGAIRRAIPGRRARRRCPQRDGDHRAIPVPESTVIIVVGYQVAARDGQGQGGEGAQLDTGRP